MKQLILIAALTLLTGTAYAGPTRSLSLASSEVTQPVEQPQVEPKAAEAPAPVERPKLVVPQEQPKAAAGADKPDKIDKPKKKRITTEARVINELHRHGISW